MSGRIPPLYCTLIFITMHSHRSHLNITTVIHTGSYEYTTTTIDTINSTLKAYRNRGLGKIVKCTLVCCIISLIVMQGYYTNNTEYTGSLSYNSVCYITI